MTQLAHDQIPAWLASWRGALAHQWPPLDAAAAAAGRPPAPPAAQAAAVLTSPVYGSTSVHPGPEVAHEEDWQAARLHLPPLQLIRSWHRHRMAAWLDAQWLEWRTLLATYPAPEEAPCSG